MLTLSMLPSSASSPVSPGKNSISATNAESFAPADTPGFGAILAHEMNEKGDRSDAKLAEGNRASNNVSDDTGAGSGTTIIAKELPGQSGEMLKDNSETENDAATAFTGSPPMDLTNILPGLAGVRFPEARIETQALARRDIPTDTQIDFGSDVRRDGSAAIRHGVLGAEGSELSTTEMQRADFAVQQQGVVAGSTTLTGIGTESVSATAAAGRNVLQITQMSAGAQADSLLAKETKAIQAGNSTALELDSRQRLPQRMEFSISELNRAGEIEKTGNEKAGTPVSELAPKDLLTAALPTQATATAATTTMEHRLSATGSPLANDFLRLEPRIGTTGWDHALGQKVLWMVSDQQQIAELNLNPPDLGPLQVVLSITDDQASAAFISQHADVRNALEAALPRLKEMMAESGIQLSDTTVSSDSQQQKGFERQDRSGARHDGRGGHILLPDVDISASRIRSDGNSLVDTFA